MADEDTRENIDSSKASVTSPRRQFSAKQHDAKTPAPRPEAQYMAVGMVTINHQLVSRSGTRPFHRRNEGLMMLPGAFSVSRALASV